MTKAEKRYFRLYAQLQGGSKMYMTLFDLFDRCSSLEEALEAFSRLYPQTQADTTLKYLYSQLLECLLHLRSGEDLQHQLFERISAAAILFERGLYEEAFRALNRAKKQAELHHQDLLALLIRQSELRYLSLRNFGTLDEKRLVGKQIRIIDLIKRIRSKHWHNQLYDILKFRFHHKGYARSERDQQKLNDLLLHELNLVANDRGRTFETEELHALFQATYFLSVGNYPAALRHYRGLIRRFEEDRLEGQRPPLPYRQALEGILNTLLAVGLYDEVPYFAAQLVGGRLDAPEVTLDDVARVYLYRSLALVHAGRLDEAVDWRHRFEERLFRKLHLLGLAIQLRLWLQDAVLWLFVGQLSEARKQMRKILASGKLLHAFPDYRAARLVNLLLLAEAGDYDRVAYEVASFRREIRGEKGQPQYAMEKLLFRFVQAYPLPFDRAACVRLWNRFEPTARQIREDRYERSLLVVCDFPAWMQSRLTAGSLSAILAETLQKALPDPLLTETESDPFLTEPEPDSLPATESH